MGLSWKHCVIRRKPGLGPLWWWPELSGCSESAWVSEAGRTWPVNTDAFALSVTSRAPAQAWLFL